jgi:predicted ATPase
VDGGLKSSRFELHRELGKGGMGVVYEAYDHETDSRVALKTLRCSEPGALLRFKNEFRALADLQHPNLLRLGELCCERGQWFFTMELVPGVDFQAYVRPGDAARGALRRDEGETQPLKLDDDATRVALALAEQATVPRGFDEPRLRTALHQLALAIDAIHRSGRIHRDIKPSNVLVRPDGHLTLLDFGLIQELRHASAPSSANLIAGTPAFIAPEQLTSDHIGPAADWYAFGTMLYLALTGTIPFGGTPDQMLTSKTSLPARAPRLVCRDIPAELDALCLALLDRVPRLRPSLPEIVAAVGGGAAPPVSVSGAPAFAGDRTRTFVGREDETAALADAYASCRAGRSVAVVVEGEPGVGKSALVRHFLDHEVALDPEAVIFAGRCYEQETVPFKAFDTVIDSLALYLTDLDRQQATALLGSGTRYLASVFPVLRQVPAIAAAGDGREVDNPLTLRVQAFGELKRLLAAIAGQVRLVLFIDDLQWADRDSVALIEHLITPPGAPRLLLVCTRRAGNETAEVQSLVERFRRIPLGGLSAHEAQVLCKRLWGAAAADVEAQELTALLSEASGHPLFLTELVRYSKKRARHAPLQASLQDVLWQRVRQLDAPERRFMECVALAGAPIKLQVVAKAAEVQASDSLQILSALRTAQMIRVSRRGEARLVEPYHDRVREAVVDHLRGGERARAQQLHLRLGQRLREDASDAELPSQVFAIVHHLNQAAELLSADERHRAAELNLLAARQAKLATAYDIARDHIDRGLRLLDGDPWHTSYALCSSLHVERMEATYLSGRRAEAEAHFVELLPRLRSEPEVAELFVTKIVLETGNALFAEAIATGVEALRRFRLPLSAEATTLSVLREYVATRLAQRGRSPAELARLPEMTDVAKQCALKILIALAPAALFANSNLLSVCLMRIARVSMRHGLTDLSSYGFAGYGLVLSGGFFKHDEGYQLGQLSLQLNERFANPRLVAKLHTLKGCFLAPWVRPMAEGTEELAFAMRAAVKHGDAAYEAYSAAVWAVTIFCGPSDLATVQAATESAREITVRRRDRDMTAAVELTGRYAAALRGLTGARDLSNHESSDAELLTTLSEQQTPIGMTYHYLWNGALAWFFGDRARAHRMAPEAEKRLERLFSIPTMVQIVLFDALVAADRWRDAAWRDKLRVEWRMRRDLGKLRRWAESCPQNHEPQYRLAVAEWARARGRSDAEERLQAALASARRHGSLMCEAIALELWARQLRDEGRAVETRARVREAIDAYERWGAHAKAVQLRHECAAPAAAPASPSRS